MTTRTLPGRRRIIAILAAAGGLKLWSSGSRADQAWSWSGTALGAAARIELRHPDRVRARALVEVCVAELRRLEASFSLYRADSELSRLNRDGRLDHPSRDLIAIMRQAQEWSERTDGAFDATVQPLWRLHADHFAHRPDDPLGPSAAARQAATALVDFRAVDVGERRIAFGKPGMAVTLNGIAQGYITDRVVDRLRDAGIESTLVDMGEIAARGLRADGTPWSIAIGDGSGGTAAILPLHDRAIATSAGHATAFDHARRFHHLFEPRTGACAGHVRAISVIADDATAADALSTALFVTPGAAMPALLRRVAADMSGSIAAIVQGHDGGPIDLAGAPATFARPPFQTARGAAE